MAEPSEESVLRVLEVADQSGSPVAGNTPEVRTRVARAALRRMRSFDRRHKARHATRADRIEDLAKGLRDELESERGLVGPLMEDYRHVASLIVEAAEGPP